MHPDWSLKFNQEYFDWVGSQTVIVVGPDQMTLYTEDRQSAGTIDGIQLVNPFAA